MSMITSRPIRNYLGAILMTVSCGIAAVRLVQTALAAEGAAGGKAVPTRAEIPEKDKWNLADLYKDDAAWDADYAKADQMVKRSKELKGSAAKGGGELLAVLKHRDQTAVLVDRLA